MLRATAAAPDEAAAADAAARILLQVIPGLDLVYGWVLDQPGRHLDRLMAAGLLPDDAGPVDRLPLDADVGAAIALKEDRVIVWEGSQEAWPERLRNLARRIGLSTVVHAPIRGGARPSGVLTLGSRGTRAYDAAELAFVAALAGQLGRELERAGERAAAAVERERFTSIIETMPEGVIILGPDGSVNRFNRAASRILGWDRQAPSWEGRYEDYRPRDADGRPIPTEDSPIARALRGETASAIEVLVRRADGSDVPLLVSAGPIWGAGGAHGGAILCFHDITRMKDLDRLKDQFINTVSHELRTPTTTIRGGALTLLRRGDSLDEETRRQLLQDIAEESERLRNLVEDLLSLSRSQAGMQMSPEPLRLSRLINKVLSNLGNRLGGAEVIVEVAPSLSLAEADPLAIEQVLRNLIENAVRHSPRGGPVEITADERDGGLVVSVLDRGPGVPAADLDRVFEPFYRLPAAIESATQGAGLGLAVCRRLVEMSGGRIWAERRRGGGSAFRFTLPIAADFGD
jgi:PAS domain S-box-containing protein